VIPLSEKFPSEDHGPCWGARAVIRKTIAGFPAGNIPQEGIVVIMRIFQHPTTENTSLDAAIKYAGHYGWPVFPVALIERPNGKTHKQPLVKWGTYGPKGDAAAIDARDPDQLIALWRRAERMRIAGLIALVVGLPTGLRSGIVILDIDVKDGRNGFDTLDDLGVPSLPDTPLAHTRTGGVHVYFARTDFEIRNSEGEHGLGLGLDIRGDGGFVVLPGPGGYWWDPHANLDTVPLLPAPNWLGHREKQAKPATARGTRDRFDPLRALDDACGLIRKAAGTGSKYRTVRRQPFIVGCLVRDGFLEERAAWHEVRAAVASLEKHVDNIDHMWKAAEGAFDEGLGAPARRRARA
jgi:hypothetical protein